MLLPSLNHVVRCCPCCNDILGNEHADNTFDVKLDDILTAAETCQICNLHVRTLLDDASSEGVVKLVRTPNALRAGCGGRRLVRFCSDPSKQASYDVMELWRF